MSHPFVRSAEQTKAFLADIDKGGMFACTVSASIETTAEYIRSVLPACFDMADHTVMSATFAKYRSYYDGDFDLFAFGVPCKYQETESIYVPYLLISRDIAVFGGREVWGERKRFGKANMFYNGEEIYAYAERNGVRLVELTAKLGPDQGPRVVADGGVCWWIKAFPDAMGNGFDKTPWIIKRVGHSSLQVVREGTAELIFRGTPNDPMDEVPVVRVLGASYNEGFHKALVPQQRIAIEDPKSIENLWYGFAYDTVSRLD